ncbi:MULTISPECIES: hypothetical protein [unclassified Streptomyces]|uniref:hypothetical protein n=1 Tax=unclassified Streptomyces TaxID=2593676 RepID=UPI00369F88EB
MAGGLGLDAASAGGQRSPIPGPEAVATIGGSRIVEPREGNGPDLAVVRMELRQPLVPGQSDGPVTNRRGPAFRRDHRDFRTDL